MINIISQAVKDGAARNSTGQVDRLAQLPGEGQVNRVDQRPALLTGSVLGRYCSRRYCVPVAARVNRMLKAREA